MLSGYRVERWAEYRPPNPAMLRLILDNEGYAVYQWVDRPGTFYGPHKHPEDQCHWVISGRLEIYVQQLGAFQLGPGDRDFMPAETYHTAQVLGDEPVLYLVGEKLPIRPETALSDPEPESAASQKPARKAAAKTKRKKKKPNK